VVLDQQDFKVDKVLLVLREAQAELVRLASVAQQDRQDQQDHQEEL
jgi:hypothetical protein